jgi:hypothetical protein
MFTWWSRHEELTQALCIMHLTSYSEAERRRVGQ